MKKFALTTAFLLYPFHLLLCGTSSDAQEMLSTAERQASVFRDDAGPLELSVDFEAQINVPLKGHLTMRWGAKDRWWRRIVLGEFKQVEIRNGDKLYTSRNASFTPIRINELISLLQFAVDPAELNVKKQKQRVENGTEMSCLQVEREGFRGKPHEICINSSTREILSDEWKEPPDERCIEEYSGYFDFRGHRYPRKLKLFVNGIGTITANVEYLQTSSLDEALLIPPKGAIERRQCADMKHAVPVRTPDPLYPKSASENRLMGDTVVAMTVLTDGSVDNIQLVGSATHSMDDVTLATLKGWKFKPAACGAEPVVSDIKVVVSFRLGP
jgi:TonB family protein